MKLENLSEGMIVKNYKELCSLLEVEPKKNGNSRNAQMKEIERYIDYEKQGHKIIVKEIYSEPLERIDNRSSGNNVAPYIEDTELLLIDLLLCAENEEIKIPTNALLEVLKIVNYNYRHFMYDKRPLLSRDLGIDIAYIDDYYNNVGSMLTGNINTVISRLAKKKLIIHKEIYMVKAIEIVIPEYNEVGEIKLQVSTSKDNEGNKILNYKAPEVTTREYYREATDIELRKILKIERETYLQLGMNENSNMNDLYRNGKKREYDDIVEKRLLSELSIMFKFKSHHLIFNRDDVQQEKYNILDEIEKDKIEIRVNRDVQSRIIENVDNRIEKAKNDITVQYIEHFGNEKQRNSSKMIRTKKEYAENYNILNNSLISRTDLASKELEHLIKFVIDNNYTIE